MEYKEKFISSITPDSLVNIVPDGATKTISVSKAILCDTSKYFVKALNGDFKESGEQTPRFPGWKVDVIEFFLFWAHKRYLPDVEAQIAEREESQWDNATADVQITLIGLWAFADEHLIVELQNDVMKHLVNLTKDYYTTASVICFGYELAPKDSTLHKFIMDEARYMYFSVQQNRPSEQDLNEMAHLPGFMSDFLALVKKNLFEETDIHYQSAHKIGCKEYMVEGR